jgi:hypothetical protein
MTGAGVTRCLGEIQRVPMLEPHEEYMLAERWREHGDHEAAHKLANSHLRLVAKNRAGYSGASAGALGSSSRRHRQFRPRYGHPVLDERKALPRDTRAFLI